MNTDTTPPAEGKSADALNSLWQLVDDYVSERCAEIMEAAMYESTADSGPASRRLDDALAALAAQAQPAPANLTDAECDEFRRLPVDFRSMVRAIYRAGQGAAQVQPATDRPALADALRGCIAAMEGFCRKSATAAEVRTKYEATEAALSAARAALDRDGKVRVPSPTLASLRGMAAGATGGRSSEEVVDASRADWSAREPSDEEIDRMAIDHAKTLLGGDDSSPLWTYEISGDRMRAFARAVRAWPGEAK